MNRRVILLSLTALAVVASTSQAVATPDHDQRPTKSHVLELRVEPVSFVETPSGYVAINNDFDSDGVQVGSDVTTCRVIPDVIEKALCDVGLGLADGLLTITFTQSEASEQASGRVTGGTGAYRGARGSVVIDEIDGGANVKITLRR